MVDLASARVGFVFRAGDPVDNPVVGRDFFLRCSPGVAVTRDREVSVNAGDRSGGNRRWRLTVDVARGPQVVPKVVLRAPALVAHQAAQTVLIDNQRQLDATEQGTRGGAGAGRGHGVN